MPWSKISASLPPIAKHAVRSTASSASRDGRFVSCALSLRRRATRVEVAQIYDAVDVALNRVKAKPHRLFDEPNPFARPARLAKDYGLEVCGRG